MICGWYGDKSETSATRFPDVFNPVKAASTILELYREICRKELILEQMYDAGNATSADLNKVDAERNTTVHSIMEVFCKLRARYETIEIEQLLIQTDGSVEWPDIWSDVVHNVDDGGCCDMLIGQCVCGKTHTGDEQWVKDKIRLHRAILCKCESFS
jgi:hypothetical protein